MLELVFASSTGPRELSDSQLTAEMPSLCELSDRIQARKVAVAAESTPAWPTLDGAANAAVWLAPRARISRAEAHQVFSLG